MTDSGSRADPVGKLAEDFMARYRRGERPALTEYTEQYPELADRIRDVFAMLVVMEEADSGASSAGGATGSGPAGAAGRVRGRPERIAGYRILREVGRGGMGVVYEAEQLALGRHVALKVLPEPIARDADGLERFRREARAAARLHHTNIVPVHEVGQDGVVVFYAMQFIQGQPLDVVLDELKAHGSQVNVPRGSDAPAAAGTAAEIAHSLLTGRFDVGTADRLDGASETPATVPSRSTSGGSTAVLPGQSGHSTAETRRHHYDRSVAQVGVQVAEALAYAHREGVIHRDIKPSNLLLDADSRVWITDFGLAKTDDDALTRTGDILGTLRYMAPERFRGWSDPRSDVYSLGLTLYEMLLLRPAFESTDRLELIRRITHEVPVRPRQLEPRIPRDLETIVLKAIDKEPSRRYPSADELAADLRRFLDREPIKARSVGPLERAWIWARRRPATAALLLVSGVAALASVGMVVGALDYQRLRLAKEQTTWALQKAEMYQYFLHIAKVHAGWREGGLSQAETLLEECEPDQRHWEWNYLTRLRHADLLTLTGHNTGVTDAVFSPDGSWIASVGEDGKVMIWDAGKGEHIRTLPGIEDLITEDYNRSVAFSPDGTRIASAGSVDGSVVIWDLQTQTGKPILLRHTHRVRSVAYSPDGNRVVSIDTGGVDGSGSALPVPLVSVWDARQGLLIRSFPGAGSFPWAEGYNRVAFSPDGTQIVLTSPGGLGVWDAKTYEIIRPFDVHTTGGHNNAVSRAAFNPEGTRIASASWDRTLIVWDLKTGKPIHRLKGHTSKVMGVAFSPDGTRLASSCLDGTVRVWDATSGEQVLSLKGHTHGAWSVAFSPDGSRLVSAGGPDGTVRVWDATTDPEALMIDIAERDAGGTGTVALSPDGSQLASVTRGGTVKTFDVTTGQIVRAFAGRTNTRSNVVYSPDGTRIASGGPDGTVILWEVTTGRVIDAPKLHRTEVWRVTFDPAGKRLAATCADRSVTVWDMTSRRALFNKPAEHPGHLPGIAISPDGRWLAAGSDSGIVRVRSTTTGKVAFTLPGHTKAVHVVAFHPDPDRPQLASGSNDGTVKIWDLTTRRERLTLGAHAGHVRGLVFSPDGRRLISASADLTAKVWDVASGLEILTLRGHLSSVWDVAISRDNDRLVTASLDGTVKVWDARPWTEDSSAEREALGQLAFLFARPLPSAGVIEYLRGCTTVRPRARQMALALVNRYHEEADAEAYHRASWAVVRRRLLNLAQYRFALLQAEHAFRLGPDRGRYRAALGEAQFRVGRYQDALETLRQAERLSGLIPADLAFLAMARHRLGQGDQARAILGRLRGLVAQPRWAEDIEVRGLLQEAEALATTP